jgi:hydrogenase nickel incorporation protein HypA/HybF
MHELSIALQVLDLAAQQAKRHGSARVAAVHVRLGPLSGVVKEALVSAYELAREGSGLDDSRLVVEEAPIQIWCAACDARRGVVSMVDLRCEVCGALAQRLLAGRELELTALEINP